MYEQYKPECERCGTTSQFVITESIADDNPYHTALCFEHLKEFFRIRSEIFDNNTVSLTVVRIPAYLEPGALP